MVTRMDMALLWSAGVFIGLGLLSSKLWLIGAAVAFGAQTWKQRRWYRDRLAGWGLMPPKARHRLRR